MTDAYRKLLLNGELNTQEGHLRDSRGAQVVCTDLTDVFFLKALQCLGDFPHGVFFSNFLFK